METVIFFVNRGVSLCCVFVILYQAITNESGTSGTDAGHPINSDKLLPRLMAVLSAAIGIFIR